MTILVDMDDVIEDLLGSWLETLNDKYSLSVHKSDVKDWDMAKAYPNLSPEQIFEPLHSKSFWETVRPIEGAAEYIQRLINDGHEVYIVTATHYTTLKTKFNCIIKKYFPFISYKNIIVAYKKQMIIGDVLIDDYPINLIGGGYKGLLFDAPYNHGIDAEKYDLIRVNSWKEIYDEICNMDWFRYERKKYED